MIIGGVVAAVLGVAAEGKSLEDVASPLSAVKSSASRTSETLRRRTVRGSRALTAGDLPVAARALRSWSLRSGPTRNSVDVFRRDPAYEQQ